MTIILRHFIINLKTKLIIPCHQTNNIKGELHSNSWNLTFVNKLQFPLILESFALKHQKIDNRSWDIYVFSHTETWFYTFSE